MHIRHAAGIAVCALAPLACPGAWADDCVRSQPAPIFAVGARPAGHSFTLRSGNEAVERFRLGKDTQVELEHGGCEYIVTRVRFSSAGLFAGGYTRAIAYRRAAALLRELERFKPSAGFDLGLAARTLQEASAAHANPEFERELRVAGDGVAPLDAVVVLHAAGRTRASGHLELVLFRGPL